VRARVHGLIGELRAAGVAVSTGETLDAMHAVAVTGVERERLREALAATLVKDEGDRPAFDEVFERCFPLPVPDGPRRRRRHRPAEAAEGAGTGRRRSPPNEAPSPGSPALADAVGDSRSGTDPAPVMRRGPRHRGADERRRRPFRELAAGEVGELCELAALLAQPLARRVARRWQATRHGPVDLRRTLRAATATGGVPLRLARRRRRPTPPDLVALCDLSGSVAAASELLLALLAPARRYFRRVELYAYVDRLCPITIERGRLVPDGTLDLHARSDFGRVLAGLQARHPRLGPNALLLVLGDARNNRRPPRADLLRALGRHARQVLWIVPEPRSRWNTGDSVLAAYARWCDAVFEAADLDGLVRAVRQAIA
jgi:hypothetical protein